MSKFLQQKNLFSTSMLLMCSISWETKLLYLVSHYITEAFFDKRICGELDLLILYNDGSLISQKPSIHRLPVALLSITYYPGCFLPL